jgi:hypothetical protein
LHQAIIMLAVHAAEPLPLRNWRMPNQPPCGACTAIETGLAPPDGPPHWLTVL